MKASSSLLFGTVLALVTSAGSARAGDLDGFVSPDKCTSRPCTCADVPMMEIFQANQVRGRDAWKSVRADLFSTTGPQSTQDAIALFGSRFKGDPRVATQFMSCTGYDATKNNLNKIAGVAGIGQAVLDPCFCNAFCQDIVDATVIHELTHGPTIIINVLNQANFRVACKTGLMPDSLCNSLDSAALADSEIVSYGMGISSLQSSIERIRKSDPAKPEMECTWTPLPPMAKRAPTPAPESFMARVKLLVQRFIHGVTA
jgi:hypothetical protein